jgi:hypothetical protein
MRVYRDKKYHELWRELVEALIDGGYIKVLIEWQQLVSGTGTQSWECFRLSTSNPSSMMVRPIGGCLTR